MAKAGIAGGAPAPTGNQAADQKLAKAAKAKKTDLDKVLGLVKGGQNRLTKAHRYAEAWAAALATAKGPEAEALRGHVGRLRKDLDPSGSGKTGDAVQILSALIESRAWTPPKVQVSSSGGAAALAVGQPVAFREGYRKWGLEKGVFTQEEADSLVVSRVSRGTSGAVFMSAKSEKSGNHFGPFEAGGKFVVK